MLTLQAGCLQGADFQADIRRTCPALSLQQIYKLTEHHHDDWISGGHSADTLTLLATLKRFADAGGARKVHSLHCLE